jgi:hypothetical protein
MSHNPLPQGAIMMATVTIHTTYDDGQRELRTLESMPVQEARDALARRIRTVRKDGQFVTRIGPGMYEFEYVETGYGPDWFSTHLVQTPDTVQS